MVLSTHCRERLGLQHPSARSIREHAGGIGAIWIDISSISEPESGRSTILFASPNWRSFDFVEETIIRRPVTGQRLLSVPCDPQAPGDGRDRHPFHSAQPSCLQRGKEGGRDSDETPRPASAGRPGVDRCRHSTNVRNWFASMGRRSGPESSR